MPAELPDFPLAVWELPPDSTEPLVAPATMQWRGTLFGRKTDWLVRVVPIAIQRNISFVVVRAASSQEEGNWWFPSVGVDMDSDRLRARISKLLSGANQKMPWRNICLRHRGDDWFIRLRDQRQSLFAPLGQRGVLFYIKWPFDFATATTSQVHDEVLRLWSDENSDLSFARHWSLLSEDQKYALMLCWSRGSEGEFLRVMDWVLIVFGPQASSNPLRWWFDPIRRKFALSHAEVNFDLSNPEQPFEHDWGKGVVQVYAPIWSEELGQTRACTRSLYNFRDRFCVFVDQPTFHEQLEAAHQLLDWLDEREARGELDAATLSRLRATLR